MEFSGETHIYPPDDHFTVLLRDRRLGRKIAAAFEIEAASKHSEDIEKKLSVSLAISFPFQIFIICSLMIYDAVRNDFNNTVRNRLNKFAVMRGKNHNAFKVCKAIIQSSNRLQVQMVGGLVQNQHVASIQHHPRQHTANTLSAGKNTRGFEYVIP